MDISSIAELIALSLLIYRIFQRLNDLGRVQRVIIRLLMLLIEGRTDGAALLAEEANILRLVKLEEPDEDNC